MPAAVIGVEVYWYGIFLALSILVGAFVADFFYRKYFLIEQQKDLLIDLMPLLIIIGLVGARLYYCFVNFSYYLAHPVQIFNVRQGGLSIHGMLISVVIFLVLFLKKKNFSFFQVAAPLVLGVSLSQAIGRWGNFFNSEAFGAPFDGFVKLYVAPMYRPLPYIDFDFFHPTFLYESVLNLFLFFYLIYLVNYKRVSASLVVFLYFFGYGIVRLIVENCRIDSISYVFGMPIASFVSLLLIIIGLCGILLDLKYKFR